MRLYITVVAGPGLDWNATASRATDGVLNDLPVGPVELVLDLDPMSGVVVENALRREVPVPVQFRVEGINLNQLKAGHPPLVSGAVIVATPPNGPVPGRRNADGHQLTFSVLAGPDTGIIKVLKRGRYSIGRTGEDIPIADPRLSRVHAELVVEATGVGIKDHGSVNGTYIDRQKSASGMITTASKVELGTSMCSLRFSSDYQNASSPSGDPAEPLMVHRESTTQRRGMMLLTGLLPLVIGIGLVLLTGMWMFLAFSAMSALTVLIPVLGGRKRKKKFRHELETAYRADASRRITATPSVAEIIGCTIHGANQSRSRTDNRSNSGPSGTGGPLAGWIRMGTADQRANVRLEPLDRDFTPTLLRNQPVSLNLPDLQQLAVTGIEQQVSALLRSLVVQLAEWFPDSGHRLLFYGPAESMPLDARFLRQVEFVQSPAALAAALKTGGDSPIVVFIAAEAILSADLDSLLHESAASGRFNIIWHGERMPQRDIPTVALLRDRAVLDHAGTSTEFVADLVNTSNFARYCRSKARTEGMDNAGPTQRNPVALPHVKALDGLTDTAIDRIRERWTLSRDSDNLRAPIGVYASGNAVIDLQHDGPHLLLAGTTGSGKSELLRTLLLSLSLNHSPRQVNFLLVDFKGGSGLGPLRNLPHSVGLLTDLSAESVERAMASLRAEVQHRESLFAAVEAGDLASYRRLRGPSMEVLPRLLIVIDEFRMLLEQVPAAMDELLRIASVGRSLGLHLVMATQRPQGAISADIRANITTSISLRVQTAMDSQDVLDASNAADISVDLPGRAYLKRSGEPIQEFQSASTAQMISGASPVRVRRLGDHFAEDASSNAVTNVDFSEATFGRYIEGPLQTWKALDESPPRPPVLPDLPDHIAEAHWWSGQEAKFQVTLGLLDLPSRQQQVALHWTPHRDSHLAVIGGARSGLNESLRNIVRQLLAAGAQNTHLYVLDGDGTLPGLEDHVPVGAYVGGNELRRAVRVIQRLAEVVADRLAAGDVEVPVQSGPGDPATGQDSGAAPALILVITGWGRWLSSIRGSPWAWAEEIIQDVTRDGGKAGVLLVVGGDRELVTARMFGTIENRLFLPTGASAESLMSWPRLPPMKKTPGRALVQGNMATDAGIAQLIACSSSDWVHIASDRTPDTSEGVRPFRVDALPRLVRPADVPEVGIGGDEVVVGLQGDDLRPAVLRVPPGAVYLILGSAKSGKTAILELLASRSSSDQRWSHMDSESTIEAAGSDLKAGGQGRETAHTPTTLLVDDADQLPPQTQHELAALHREGNSVIMTATISPSVMSHIPLAAVARSAGRGMVLVPRSAFDGEFFGVRLDTDSSFPPGRAMMIEGSQCVETQLLQRTQPETSGRRHGL